MVVLMAMSAVTFLLSQRNIVVANAERFIYHALLVGFPLMMLPAIRGYYWVVSRINVRSDSLREKVVYVSAVAAVACIVLMPGLISGARAHDQLMRQDRQVIDLGYREAMEYVRRNTHAESVFLVNPDAPWALPMLTGRSMLRADYWLGLNDEVLYEVELAFMGQEVAQRSALQKVDYLILNHEEQNNWKLDEQEEVFRGGRVSIYKTKR
jgi:hypothetical protein